MILTKVLAPVFALAPLFLVACGPSDAAVGDSASRRLNGKGGSSSSAPDCSKVTHCPNITAECAPGQDATPPDQCCPVCIASGSGGTGSGGSAGTGGAVDCSLPRPCPQALTTCQPGQPEVPPGQCCQVCVTPGSSSGVGGADDGAAGAPDCSKIEHCPDVYTKCASGQAAIPRGQCCATCVP